MKNNEVLTDIRDGVGSPRVSVAKDARSFVREYRRVIELVDAEVGRFDQALAAINGVPSRADLVGLDDAADGMVEMSEYARQFNESHLPASSILTPVINLRVAVSGLGEIADEWLATQDFATFSARYEIARRQYENRRRRLLAAVA
jgi:hypothetical protein